MLITPVIRRVVLWRWTDQAIADQKLRAEEGLAYISYASRVDAVDFGEDIGLGNGSNYDLVLLRDHRDKESWDAYNVDRHHYRVGDFIDTLTHEEITTRADYLYNGLPSIPGRVRHLALYFWRPGIDDGERQRARRALASLRADCPSLAALEVSDDLGWARLGRADLIVEAHFEDAEGAALFLEHPAQREVATLLDSVTDAGRTAQIQQRMMSG